ncbi:MAG: hypothetical protein M1837_004066 [Sclerophora amabilis]|nr:MAG: hypothetical protein M1837_004066 [Sclerophora amabilis]
MLGARRVQSPNKQPRLPRGECRFILLHPEINGQRCCCQSFWHNEDVPGASCECGHQACYHEPNIPNEGVSHEEHQALVKRLSRLERDLVGGWTEQVSSLHKRAKHLEDAIDSLSEDREEGIKEVYRAIQGVYQHIQHSWVSHSKWLMHQDDKVEAVVDKISGIGDDIRNLRERVIHIDDVNMALEDRWSEAERGRHSKGDDEGGHPSKQELHSEFGNKPPDTWKVNVKMMLLASQPTSFDTDSIAHRRCVSRRLVRSLNLEDASARSVRNKIESSFGDLLAGRSWMPLVAKTSGRETPNGQHILHCLHEDQTCSDLWDAGFLAKNCTVQDGPDGISELYIALRHGALSWDEIRRQPVFKEGLEASWEHDERLDGKRVPDDEGLDVDPPEDERSRSGDLVDKKCSPTSPPVPTLKRSFSSLSDGPTTTTTTITKSTNEATKRMRLRTSLPEMPKNAILDTSPRTSEVA